jgi:hypothetical protein
MRGSFKLPNIDVTANCLVAQIFFNFVRHSTKKMLRLNQEEYAAVGKCQLGEENHVQVVHKFDYFMEKFIANVSTMYHICDKCVIRTQNTVFKYCSFCE